ncbi:TlpA disulfide reductase family protein [Sphingobacterium yanglingense]|uniref:Thiol-disulfide isomerase/thioredoxin n=1 Tax=Sphingobacterium yanglingense TaxID=1437280 RepID=A0A4R6WDH8_9SPHI|nr:TlpA disulfide reductase family protein [Sphingobacterium yanglingense]TDQ75397.1 thiol-disulfide isomerase/thioredoxin [Sphingobacterium yanglingense]
MKIRSIVAVFAFSVLSFFTVKAQTSDKVVLVGKVDPKYNSTKVYLYNNITGDSDTTVVENGGWRIELPFTVPTRHMLASEAESKKHGGYAPFGVLVDGPGTVTVEGDLESFYTSKVSGSKSHDVLNQYFALVQEQGGNEAAVMAEVVAKNANSFGAAFLLDRYGKVMIPEDALKAYEGLSSDVKKSFYGKSAGNQIKGALLSKEGAVVKDFTLLNEKGMEVSFSSLKGNYVLLDFWASWCGPCIEEFKTLKEVYAKYKGKAPFEILSISTDKSEAAWKGALKSQQLPWVQMHDVTGDDAIATSRFAVTALPTTFLIGPDGTIVAKNLRGKELEAYLAKLFGS